MTDELLTPDDVAAVLKIPRKTVLYLARRGDIPSLKVGRAVRIRRRDLNRYIEQQGAAA